MKSILIVEDFATSRKVIVNTLSGKGYKTYEAEDGVEALALLDGRKVDLVVTDYNMPKMNGAVFVKEMRKINQYKYIPVLVLSTETSQEKQLEAKDAQITSWIFKPFDITRFLKIVEKSLK